MQIGNAPISFAVVTVLFAFLRFVPEQTLPWKRLRPGAVLTAVLFTARNYLLGLYPGVPVSPRLYGAAGSLVVLFDPGLILVADVLVCAEFTRMYAVAPRRLFERRRRLSHTLAGLPRRLKSRVKRHRVQAREAVEMRREISRISFILSFLPAILAMHIIEQDLTFHEEASRDQARIPAGGGER